MSFKMNGLEFIVLTNGTYGVSGLTLSVHSKIVIPANANGKTVTKILDNAFQGFGYLKSVTIPDSITSIGNFAFHSCGSLENITIPDNVTNIGKGAFYGCKRLKNITIPDNVTRIDDFAFRGCSSLQSIAIPNNVTSIGDEAFYGCRSLTSISIPDTVMKIGKGTFYGCKKLNNITIPESLMSKDLFGDLLIFYTQKLYLYKNNPNIQNNKQNETLLYEIENLLNTIPSKRMMTIFSIICVLSFSLYKHLYIGCTLSLIWIIILLVNILKRNEKFNNIESKFSIMDYHQKTIQEENCSTTLKLVEPKNEESKNLSVKEKLIQLKELYEEGLITEAEYNEQKKEYINKL